MTKYHAYGILISMNGLRSPNIIQDPRTAVASLLAVAALGAFNTEKANANQIVPPVGVECTPGDTHPPLVDSYIPPGGRKAGDTELDVVSADDAYDTYWGGCEGSQSPEAWCSGMGGFPQAQSPGSPEYVCVDDKSYSSPVVIQTTEGPVNNQSTPNEKTTKPRADSTTELVNACIQKELAKRVIKFKKVNGKLKAVDVTANAKKTSKECQPYVSSDIAVTVLQGDKKNKLKANSKRVMLGADNKARIKTNASYVCLGTPTDSKIRRSGVRVEQVVYVKGGGKEPMVRTKKYVIETPMYTTTKSGKKILNGC